LDEEERKSGIRGKTDTKIRLVSPQQVSNSVREYVPETSKCQEKDKIKINISHLNKNRAMLHHALETTETMTIEARAQWIKEVSRESFTHTKKEFFTEEEIAEKHKRSTDYTRDIIHLNDAKKLIMDAFTKGNSDEYETTIPQTTGIKSLTEERDRLVREVDKGFIEHTFTIFGVPNEDGQMYYFDIEGNIIEERTRSLSIREKKETFGFFGNETEVRKISNS